MSATGFRDFDQIDYGEEELRTAADMVRERSNLKPKVALILGSGLGVFADNLDRRTAIPYAEIPGFPEASVPGHEGRLVLGRAEGIPVVAQQGRFHPYEGHSAATVTFPLRVMHRLGARVLVVTNAAGAVDPLLEPGDLMLIEDIVNFQFRSPLRGRGPLVDSDRFVDLCQPLCQDTLQAAREAAVEAGMSRVRVGTYWGNLGPTYETAAEVRMIRTLGADAVGMSTAAEVIVANQLRMRVLGISAISNKGTGLTSARLSHDEVMAVAAENTASLDRLLRTLLRRI